MTLAAASSLRPEAAPRVPVSLVVPLRNERAHLEELIASIRQQTTLPDEVILVDGGSTDGTPAMADRLIGDDARFRVIEAGPATPGRGRNVGMAAARNAWVALTDGGIQLEPGWLAALLDAAQRNPGVSIVYGAYEPRQDTFFEQCATLAYVHPPEVREGGTTRGRFIASSLVRVDAWKAAGGFPDLRAAEDLMFMERVREAGCEEAWAPRARVWWRLQPTLGGTYRRFALYSRRNVEAGRQRYWHYGVARQYLVGAVFIGLALIHSWWWLAVPVLGGLARVARSILLRRGAHGWRWCFNPVRFALVGVIILTTDTATLVGWAKAST